eukprot:scaffold24736_cov126-Isochrysis_galbana.AAC.2
MALIVDKSFDARMEVVHRMLPVGLASMVALGLCLFAARALLPVFFPKQMSALTESRRFFVAQCVASGLHALVSAALLGRVPVRRLSRPAQRGDGGRAAAGGLGDRLHLRLLCVRLDGDVLLLQVLHRGDGHERHTPHVDPSRHLDHRLALLHCFGPGGPVCVLFPLHRAQQHRTGENTPRSAPARVEPPADPACGLCCRAARSPHRLSPPVGATPPASMVLPPPGGAPFQPFPPPSPGCVPGDQQGQARRLDRRGHRRWRLGTHILPDAHSHHPVAAAALSRNHPVGRLHERARPAARPADGAHAGRAQRVLVLAHRPEGPAHAGADQAQGQGQVGAPRGRGAAAVWGGFGVDCMAAAAGDQAVERAGG